MAILDSLIIVSCVGMSGPREEACNKALEATAKQSGVYQSINYFEKRKIKSFEKSAVSMVGSNAANIVGGTVWIAKMVSEKKVEFGLPNFGVCDKLSTEIEKDKTQLVFKWKF